VTASDRKTGSIPSRLAGSAFVLGTSLVLTLRVYRHGIQEPAIGGIPAAARAKLPVLEKHLRGVRG